METLAEKVIRLVVEETGRSMGSIAETDCIDDLTDDSIRLFMLVTRFEREFGFKAKYEDLMNIVTVGDIVKKLEKK